MELSYCLGRSISVEDMEDSSLGSRWQEWRCRPCLWYLNRKDVRTFTLPWTELKFGSYLHLAQGSPPAVRVVVGTAWWYEMNVNVRWVEPEVERFELSLQILNHGDIEVLRRKTTVGWGAKECIKVLKPRNQEKLMRWVNWGIMYCLSMKHPHRTRASLTNWGAARLGLLFHLHILYPCFSNFVWLPASWDDFGCPGRG